MAAWANLSAMTVISLKRNNINGTMAKELGTAWPNLVSLDLSGIALQVGCPHERASSVERA